MKSLAGRWLKIAALMLAGLLAGCGNGGDSSSTQTFPSSATVFYMHSVAFRNSTTMAWGYNAFGQVGDNSTTQREVPKLTGLVGMRGTSVGSNHSLAFMNNSTVRAWGYNGYGQLGDNTTDTKTVPVKVSNISGVTAVAAGGYHSLALKSDKVWAWGLNSSGQLGNSSTTNSSVPVEVTALSSITQIAAGGSHSVALQSGGAVWTWGANGYGQLGDGTTTNSATPVQVKKENGDPLGNVTMIAAGGAFTVAVDGSNNVWVWGYNGYGQLGLNPASKTSSNVAVQVTNITTTIAGTIMEISAGADHVLALKSDKTVWAWGLNRYGQLGDGSTTDRFTPAVVTALTVDSSLKVDGVNQIVASGLHSLARKNDGKLVTWGYNANGQLGDGSTTNRSTPVAVSGY